jgi:4a-hydroxytetrahydrobiopterin dehydratase
LWATRAPAAALSGDGVPLEAIERKAMTDLASKQCVPCRGGVPPLKGAELQALLRDVNNGWQVIDEHHLEKEYRFRNFREALDFAIRVGELAEEQRHHPDIFLAWGKVRLAVWTHKIDGLTESDFVFAAKADRQLKTASGT